MKKEPKYITKVFKTHKEAVNNFKADCVIFSHMNLGADQHRQDLHIVGDDFYMRYASEERFDWFNLDIIPAPYCLNFILS